jgi:spore coat polysaccharide biosynthesis protein SpsF (cytidylyltransferase family)
LYNKDYSQDNNGCIKRVVGIVQVRMGSKRLPGKAMAEIVGRPMTWHIAERIGHAELIEEVVIALPDMEPDEPIRQMAEAHSIPYFAGSDFDLIDRIYGTALEFGADALVRVTGDCPLVDPSVLDLLVATYLEGAEELDYVSNVRPPTFPHGLGAEIYSTATLGRLWEEIKDPFYREWFPVYFWEREGEFRALNVESPQNLSHLRWTVDYKEDMEFVRRVYEHLYREGEVFGMAETLELIYSSPEISAINSMHPCDNGFLRALGEQTGLEALTGQEKAPIASKHFDTEGD